MGTFDLLHPGHLHLFSWCRKLAGEGGQVVATVNSDRFVESYKGRPPVMAEDDRAAVVASLADVDDCRIYDQVPDGGNARPTISAVRPDIIAAGEDWYGRDYFAQLGVDAEWLLTRTPRIFIAYVPLLEGHSSTSLRERAEAGLMHTAAELARTSPAYNAPADTGQSEKRPPPARQAGVAG